MCDAQTARQIARAVETKMMRGEMFTAFDITLTLQQQKVCKLHREIRRDIRGVAEQLMWSYGYQRSLVSFTEIGMKVFVYHSAGTEARLHRLSIRQPALAVTKRLKFDLFRRSRTA